MVLANLIGGFVAILVGVTLMPTIADRVEAATGNVSDTNLTAASRSIVDLTNIFFALGIMSAGVALAVAGLRQAGLV